MLANQVSEITGQPLDQVTRWLSMAPADIYPDADYQHLVKQLDVVTLERTANYAREAYERDLPAIKNAHGLAGTVMGGYTLVNWVMGYLMYPERVQDLVNQHATLPRGVIEAVLPELLAILDTVPDGGSSWKQALVILTLPLVAQG